MIDPGSVQVVDPSGSKPGGEQGQEGGSDGSEQPPGEMPTLTPQQTGKAKINPRIGLQSIYLDESEAIKMAKGTVQTIYVRKVNEKGELEQVPYVPVDVKANVKRGHTQMDPRWDVEQSKTMKAPKNKEETPLKPAPRGVKPAVGEAAPVAAPAAPAKAPAKPGKQPVDGDNGGIRTEPKQVPIGQKAVSPNPPPAPSEDGEDDGYKAPGEVSVKDETADPNALPPAGQPGAEQPGQTGAPEQGQPGAGGQPGGAPGAGSVPRFPGYFNPKNGSIPRFAGICFISCLNMARLQSYRCRYSKLHL
jgi:hypothetical protein